MEYKHELNCNKCDQTVEMLDQRSKQKQQQSGISSMNAIATNTKPTNKCQKCNTHQSPKKRKQCYYGLLRYLHTRQSSLLSCPIVFVILLTLCLNHMTLFCSGFNLDTRTATVHTAPGDPGSMFGYSVAQHRDGRQNWVLIGAPRAQSEQELGLERPGAVYRCRFDLNECQRVPVDRDGNEAPWTGANYAQIEEKSHMMLGASVYSSGNDGIMVACAPNYMYFTEERDRREPVGQCYVSNEYATTFTKISPCRKILRETDSQTKYGGSLPEDQTPYGYKKQGFCQSGFSAILTSDAVRLVTGAVGSYFWQGQVFSQSLEDSFDTLQTPEHPDKDTYDYSYMGYSMSTGHFNDDRIEDYVVGSPKMNLTGRVTVTLDNLNIVATMDGLQLGEYFGYSVTAADFNGDGLDDVAVGAPFYTDYDDPGYESGRVHVFFQIAEGVFSQERVILRGSGKSKSRFGLSVSHVGDINKDEYEDLAVGAPYDGEGEDSRGAVYIFHGSVDGIQTSPSQVIYAADISTSLSTFGYSLSGGMDQDDNLYPDLLVGAYESDRSVTLKARPIIQVRATLKLEPSDIILDRKLCDLPSGVEVACFTVKSCLMYDGVRTPSDIVLSLQWRVDSLKGYTSRAYIFQHHAYNNITRQYRINLIKSQQKCLSFVTYIKPEIRDKLTPIAVKLDYELEEPRYIPPGEPTAMLDEDESARVTAQANIKKDCGEDNVCIPDLSVSAFTSVEKYVFGTSTNINIKVRVRNNGEGSYESTLLIQLPPGVNYINIDNIKTEISVQCEAGNKTEEGISVLCDIGNPLPAARHVGFTLKTKAFVANYSVDMLSYTFTVNSSNPERSRDVSDNIDRVHIPVTTESKIRITGVSNPEQVLYNDTLVPVIDKEEDVGPEVVHLYEVRNIGTNQIDRIAVVINWPATFADGFLDLMYLPIMPRIIRGNGSCEVNGINYQNLTVRDDVSDIDMEVYSGLERVLESNPRNRNKRGLFKSTFGDQNEHVKTVECGVDNQLCSHVECTVGPLDPEENVLIQVISRVWINTIIELQSSYRGLIITSDAVAMVTKLPKNLPLRDEYTDTFQVETYVAALYLRPAEAYIPWWVIAVSVVLGFLVLLLLILLLRWCGFFKRKKTMDHVPEHTGIVEKKNGDVTPHRSSPQRTYNYDAVNEEEFYDNT